MKLLMIIMTVIRNMENVYYILVKKHTLYNKKYTYI